ncbi:MAG: transporter substrate-binding domain-containing protein [Eggerthellaceae bacterium]
MACRLWACSPGGLPCNDACWLQPEHRLYPRNAQSHGFAAHDRKGQYAARRYRRRRAVPVSTNSSSAASGLDVDMAAALADQLGLKLEVVSLGTGEVDVQSALAKGDVDIVVSATSDKGDSVGLRPAYADGNRAVQVQAPPLPRKAMLPR